MQIRLIVYSQAPWSTPRDLVGELRGKLALPRVRLTEKTWRPSLATAGTQVGLMTLPGRFEAPSAWPVRVGVVPERFGDDALVRCYAVLRWLGVCMPRRVPRQTESPERYGVS